MTPAVRSADSHRVLVVDVGSSSARCWLFDDRGNGSDPGSGSRARYEWDLSGGAMERDPADLLSRVAGTIDVGVECARRQGWEIIAVAVTTFWHSILGLDGDGEPVTSLTGWGDTRAADFAERLAGGVDAGSLHARTGCFLHSSYPLVRLAWLRDSDPAAFQGVARWVSFAEYLERELFGELRCSHSMASGSGLLDVRRLEWDAEALELAGLTLDRLSPLVDAEQPISGLRDPYGERWPELAGIPWFPPLGDGGCANLGSGAIGPDRMGITIGTTAAVRVLVDDEPGFRIPPDLWAYRLDRRRWVVGRAFSNGGNALRLLRDTLAIHPGQKLDDLLREPGADDHDLVILPFLVGERAPGPGGDPGGAMLGLRLNTTPAQFARAWLEAIAYRIAGVCERIEGHFGARGTPRISGGGLHGSREWAQILCDTLDRPLVIPAEREETSRGAALMALAALGLLPASELPEPPASAELRPDPRRHARHVRGMRRQRQLERLFCDDDETGGGSPA